MGLYDFQHRFVHAIRTGRKQHTIRAKRKHPDKPGKTIHCYVGLRHKGARLLGRWPCVKVEDITIIDGETVIVEGICLSETERDTLAYHDGFKNWLEMREFWNGRTPFQGHIIHWRRGDK